MIVTIGFVALTMHSLSNHCHQLGIQVDSAESFKNLTSKVNEYRFELMWMHLNFT